MISKIKTGNYFEGCCRYVCADKTRAEILCVNGVRAHNHNLMAMDFNAVKNLRPGKSKAVFHGILSFYPGEQINNTTLTQIAQEYLQELKMTDTQFVVARHKDKAHNHLHIIANLVNLKGESFKENWIGLRAKKIAQKLTKKYNLVPAIKKDMQAINLQKLNKEEQIKYELFEIIHAELERCNHLQELLQNLKQKNIGIQLKEKKRNAENAQETYISGNQIHDGKGKTIEVQGISFRKNDCAFKGSEIDRKFSIRNLQKYFEQKVLKVSQDNDYRGMKR